MNKNASDLWLLPDLPYVSYDDYRERTGENALEKARAMEPEALIAEILRSGLRGRGGAGFPTGIKWRTLRDHPCETRFVVCNAAEGEPGTFKDRFLIRKNPYALLEGLLIAAHAISARAIYIATQASFSRELSRLRQAMGEFAAAGLLSGIDLTLTEGPDEYLFGEEKALLEVIEGNEPMPREAHNPPYELGLFASQGSANPALVNNAQTFAHVPGIVRSGAEAFRKLGTHDTPGTLLFTVSGAVKKPGVYECEAGISLKTLFYTLAGGPLEGRSFKAALCGVSSGIIPAGRFDVAADFASLQLIGSGLGSAGFFLLDDKASMPRVAQAVARFLYVESCNQCSACKHGLRTASEALNELFDPAQASADDIPRALYGARSAPQGNRCYLPVQGSILIPSLYEGFKPEFDALVHLSAPLSEPVLVPKMIDFIEETNAFVMDERVQRKRPDWSYDEPEPFISPPRTKAPTDGATLSVRLSAEISAAITDECDRSGKSADAIVNEALKIWLKQRG